MQADSQSHNSLTAPERFDLAVELFRMLSDQPHPGGARAGAFAPAGPSGAWPGAATRRAGAFPTASVVGTPGWRAAGQRAGNQIFYRLENSHVRQLVEDAIYHAEHTGGGIPEHHQGSAGLSELRTQTSEVASTSR